MRNRRILLLAAVVLAVGLLAAGCGSGDEEVASTGDASSDTTSSDTPASDVTTQSLPGSHPSDPSWTRIEPTDELLRTAVVAPTELVVDPDDDSVVLVRFYGGVQDCYGANATVVREDDSVVEIRLTTGTRPEAADRACIEIAEAQELAVALDAPLDDRRLSASEAG